MSGIAGSCIALAQAQSSIAPAQSLTDAGTVGRGCTTGFIGFGKLLTSEEMLPKDFDGTDDLVRLAVTGGKTQLPTYAAVSGADDRNTLSWVEQAT